MTNLGRGKARTALAVSAVAVLGVVAACGSNDSGPGTSGDTAAKVEINRQAAGDITTHGGAKRLAGDQTQAIADSIQRSTAKNVILVIGDGTAIRAHEGTVEIGDKVVFGRDNVVNGYLDISIGESTLIADWIYICDFDHKFEQLGVPIKDQGIAKLPVRIGADCWLGTKVSVLRGTETGPGCVFAAHTVVRGDIPAYSVVAGVPGKVIKRRLPADPVRSGQQRPVGAPEIGPAQRRARPDEVDDE